MNHRRGWLLFAGLIVALALPAALPAAEMGTATPGPLVQSYESLADVILAAKKTEWNLVHSILAMTYQHAEATMQRARAKVEAGQGAAADIEALAALVAQLGNEGDAAVAAVRKRLVEGGHHHHHADDTDKGEYDTGFVIVNRAAKKVFLDAGMALGKMASKPDVAGLDAEWGKVKKQFAALHEAAR